MLNYSPASLLVGIAAIGSLLANAKDSGILEPPHTKPLLRVEMISAYPVNSTSMYGDAGQVPNVGGNVTGTVEGTLLPVGASYELLARNNSVGFYSNTFAINTTSTVLTMDVRATLTYANFALHGFGAATFSTDPSEDNEYHMLNYGSYVVEVAADFRAGSSEFEVFELVSSGRIDGEPIPALLPPGEAEEPEKRSGRAFKPAYMH